MEVDTDSIIIVACRAGIWGLLGTIFIGEPFELITGINHLWVSIPLSIFFGVFVGIRGYVVSDNFI